MKASLPFVKTTLIGGCCSRCLCPYKGTKQRGKSERVTRWVHNAGHHNAN
jgi:hypothetical protein